jgi:hypothetical protein
VWKFSTPASVQQGYRTCTLYSRFKLPSGVAIEININSTINKNTNINVLEMLKALANVKTVAPLAVT